MVHTLADCSECGWQSNKYFDVVRKEAYSHAKKTGHKVTGETGFAFTYTPQKEKCF